jgi:RNA polymerase sigma factor (TIGR02999 family)
MEGAEAALLDLVRRDLHDIASALMRREGAGHVLQPTALINEAYLRLFGGARIAFTDRKHFFRTAARAMRRVLIDEGRRRRARRRGGDPQPVELDERQLVTRATPDEALALAEALEALAARDARQADIMDLHFWAGYSDKEIARDLQLSERTIEREIRAGVLFVRRFLATP